MGEAPPEDLMGPARRSLKNSYAPYSGYRVAAAVRGRDGRVYVGVNVENSSYGLTMCAERVAVFSCVASGCGAPTELLVVFEKGGAMPPCGACLQVLSEFSGDMDIHSYSLDSRDYRKYRLGELLTERFKLKAT